MQRILRAWLILVWIYGSSSCLSFAVGQAAPEPELPKPTKEHDLLKQFAGEWQANSMLVPVPGDQKIKCKGTESAKMIGGFWLVSEIEVTLEKEQIKSILTIGYDETIKKYVGTFVCSRDSNCWRYVGEMDASGKKLTALSEGPSPFDSTRKAKFRDSVELKGPDHKVYTSYIQQEEDSRWLMYMTMEFRRKP